MREFKPVTSQKQRTFNHSDVTKATEMQPILMSEHTLKPFDRVVLQRWSPFA